MDISSVSGSNANFGVQGSAPVAPSAEPVQVKTEQPARQDVIIEEKKPYEFGVSEKEEKGEASKNSIAEAVKKLNSSTDSMEAVFGIHDDTNRVTIKMVDKASKEVLKEFPAEQTLDMIAKVWELAGIMVDEKR